LNVRDSPTNNSNSLGFVEASQIEEAGILVVLVKDGSGSIFEVVRGEDSDAIPR
jgi:hypothetical protein